MTIIRDLLPTLALCAIAAAIFGWSLAWGMGLSPDSMFYLAQSTGLVDRFSVSQFEDRAPPLYPLLQYLTYFLIDDTFLAVKALHVLIYGVNAFLFAYLVFELTDRSRAFAIIAVMVHVCSAVIYTLHSYALTEPVFVTFFLFALLFMRRYIAGKDDVWLFAAGGAVGLLLTTRFASISFLGSIALFVFLVNYRDGVMISVKRCAKFVMPAVLLPVSWALLKHALDPGADSPRSLQYHPISLGHMRQMLEVFGEWLYLDVSRLLFIALLLVVAHMIYVRIKAGRLDFIAFLALNAGFYVLFIAVSKSFFDAYIPIDQRIMLPVLYLALIFLFECGWEFVRSNDGWQWRAEAGVFLLLLVVIGGVKTWTVGKENYLHGSGFASRAVQDLEMHGLVAASTAEVVYTNAPELVRLYAGREATLLPHFFEPSSRVSNEGWVDEVSGILQAVDDERAAIVYYSAVNWRTYLPTPEFFVEQYGLVPGYSTAEGAIFEGPLR